MSTTIDEVMDTVRESRHRGPDALAALALCYGADAVGWMIRHAALRRELLDAERGMDEAREERDSLRTERDAASAAAKAARQRMEEVREQCDRARDDAEMCARQRDEARSRASMLAQDLARAVEEREAFSLRLSAAERERDDARAERDAALARPTYEARTTMPTPDECDVHQKAGGRWLRAWHRLTTGTYCICVVGAMDATTSATDGRWLPIDASGLPCAWPVAP